MLMSPCLQYLNQAWNQWMLSFVIMKRKHKTSGKNEVCKEYQTTINCKTMVIKSTMILILRTKNQTLLQFYVKEEISLEHQ